MLPQLEPKHESVQVTAVLFVKLPAAVAVNCCVWPLFSDAVPGVTAEIVIGTRLTDAVAVLLLPALAVAVTVTTPAALMLAGAV
jgi:hypothetical protein